MHTITGTGKRLFFRAALLCWTFALLAGCHSPQSSGESDSNIVSSVKVAGVDLRDLRVTETFPATVVYLNKSNMDASLSGNLKAIYVRTGDFVTKGDPLFQIETREHEVIAADSSLQQTGLNNLGIYTVKAPASGYIAAVNHQQGDYVQVGTTICSFTRDDQMFVKTFLPAEMRSQVKRGEKCQIIIPGNSSVPGEINQVLNELDPASQSLQVLIKPVKKISFAENLNLQVMLTIQDIKKAQMVPAPVVLSSEKLDHFWVMKMINDTTAVKVPVTIGARQGDSVQIVSPRFNPDISLISEGNYGLSDTAIVKITR